MAAIAAIPAAAWLGMAIGGTVLSSIGQIQQGREAESAARAQARSAEFAAAQRESIAKQEVASSQREALEQRRQGQLRQSRAQAVAAASGGGVSDPTVVNILGDLGAETEYLSRVALFGGESRARTQRLAALSLRDEAAQLRRQGRAARRAGVIGAGGTLLSGLGGLYGRYGTIDRTGDESQFIF